MMKRGIFFLIILLILVIAGAQETKDEIRVNIDSKLLGKEGIIINLTEFLGSNLDYYLVNKPQYVRVQIDSDYKLARITSLEGKNGSEVIIITTNKSKEFSINETVTVSERVEDDFQNNIKQEFNFSFDPIVNKVLLESIKNLKLEREEIYNTNINFTGDVLFINIDNRTALNLSFSKGEEELVLKNISLNFESEDQDVEYLFYEKKGFNFIYFLKNNGLNILIVILSIILIILIVMVLSIKRKKEVSKEDFKKVYVNKINILRRSCHENNFENVFAQFSDEMRGFLARMLNIKYQFTYDELINELMVKKIEESIKNDLMKFAKVMLEIGYRKKLKLKEIKDIIENGLSIIKRF